MKRVILTMVLAVVCFPVMASAMPFGLNYGVHTPDPCSFSISDQIGSMLSWSSSSSGWTMNNPFNHGNNGNSWCGLSIGNINPGLIGQFGCVVNCFCHHGGHGGGNTAPVPEPATMLLFGAGMVGLGVVRKRTK